MNKEDQVEMDFFFWVGDGGDSISVTEEEFEELFQAKRALQNDYLDAYRNNPLLDEETFELGYN